MNADDELVVNLIVISKVQINTKLYTSGIYLNLEQPSYIPESVRRWIRQDSRDETIKKINRIVTRALEEYKRDPIFFNSYKEHLLDAKKGLLNLRETYSNCIQTVARIDTLISKISSIDPPNTLSKMSVIGANAITFPPLRVESALSGVEPSSLCNSVKTANGVDVSNEQRFNNTIRPVECNSIVSELCNDDED